MIERYTRPEMGQHWREEVRFECLLEVEKAVARVQAKLGIIPKSASLAIQKRSQFQIKRIQEIEAKTKHDVIAFVSNVAENVGPEGRYLHFGMTSSDVLDTALSLQLARAGQVLLHSVESLAQVLKKRAQEHAKTLCAGRTHGMWAEPTTFGFKLAGYYAELKRNQDRLKRALQQVSVVKLSGAVGTYSSQDERVERMVAAELALPRERLATQVVPRDRHAELLWSMAMVGAGLQRLAIELRHLQRSEVGEVVEGFTPGQKGSSAMPHKKNPISAENISGLARLLNSYAQAAYDNIPLWHERDISHSSVERVIFADSFIVLDYMLHRMQQLLSGMFIDEKRMLANMAQSQGQIFSSQALLLIVRHGWSREEAYQMVQANAHSLQPGESLMQKLLGDPQLKKIKKSEWQAVFDGEKIIQTVQPVLRRVLK